MYRKRTRSDELVDPTQFRFGLVVWVANDGTTDGEREQHVCIGVNGAHIPLEEYRRLRVRRAKENVMRFPHRPRRKRDWADRHHFGLCW